MRVWCNIITDKEIFCYNMDNVRKMEFKNENGYVYVTFNNGDRELVTGVSEKNFKRIVGVE